MSKWSEEEARILIANVARGKVRARREGNNSIPAPAAREIGRKMNGTELRYMNLLELRKKAGEIVDYRYEHIKLTLTPARPGMKGMTYTPDFEVIMFDPEARIQLHETKSGYIRDDAWIKFKMAVTMYPEFRFVLAQYIKGNWYIKEFKETV